MKDYSAPSHFRDDTNDREIWEHVFQLDEYQLPDDLSGKTILDIGAHIGSFAALCLHRRAARIYCFEPNIDSFQLLQQNLADDLDKVTLSNAAVYSSVTLHHTHSGGANSGGNSLWPERRGFGQPQNRYACWSIPLDDILRTIGHVDLLKIDVEGSEFPILLRSKELHRVDRIYGEWHEAEQAPEAVNGSWEWRVEMIRDYLAKFSFRMHWWPAQGELGLFQATRES